MSKPVVFIYGPTAVGKTALAERIYDDYPVDLISVDAAQVYRGMDIGTAKPDPDELARYPHALIDIKDPSEGYSAAEFVTTAEQLIEQSHQQGRVPVLVGGTMFYFNALENGLSDLPDSDASVRAQLIEDEQSQGLDGLYQRLVAIDPLFSKNIKANDRQRIHRGLELSILTGEPPSELMVAKKGIKSRFDLIKIALAAEDRVQLHSRIEQRFEQMLKNGLINEVECLYNRTDLSDKSPAMRVVGYRQVWEYLEGGLSYQDMLLKAQAATRQLAKRQYTWLRNQSGNTWFLNDKTTPDCVVRFLIQRVRI